MNSKYKVPFVNIALQYQDLKKEILEAYDRICLSGNQILNEDVGAFEKAVASFCGAKHAVAVANGGDALFLSLKALGVGLGDEVLVPANSFIASAWSVVAVGARPVFVDVADDMNLDPTLLETYKTEKTKAIMPVHLTGRPAAMNEIMAFAKKHALLVVEDAAQAIGAKYDNKPVGGIGNAGCFSLHPLKNLHVHGDGGLIVTQDSALAEKLLLLRNHGLKTRDEAVIWGYNSRLDSVNAAIANLKLKRLPQWNQRHRDIASFYCAELKNYCWVPEAKSHEECIYHRFIIRTDKRNDLQKHLDAHGVETKVNYPIPLHLQPVSRELGYKEGLLPVTEKQARQILSLPVYPELNDDQVQLVVKKVKEFFG